MIEKSAMPALRETIMQAIQTLHSKCHFAGPYLSAVVCIMLALTGCGGHSPQDAPVSTPSAPSAEPMRDALSPSELEAAKELEKTITVMRAADAVNKRMREMSEEFLQRLKGAGSDPNRRADETTK